MKKLFIFVMCLLVLFAITLSGCDSSTETSETQKLISDYSFFETEDSEEYLKFLNEIDGSSTKKIVAISNSSYRRKYTGPFTVYTVTYKICEDTKDTNVQYEYSLFETEDEQKYLSFLDELSDEYEIVDISTGTYAFQYTGPYNTFIVTYRKPL